MLLEGTFKNMLDFCCISHGWGGSDTPCFPRECCRTIVKLRWRLSQFDVTWKEPLASSDPKKNALGGQAHS